MARPRDTDSWPGCERRFQEAGCKGTRRGEGDVSGETELCRAWAGGSLAGLCVPRDGVGRNHSGAIYRL